MIQTPGTKNYLCVYVCVCVFKGRTCGFFSSRNLSYVHVCVYLVYELSPSIYCIVPNSNFCRHRRHQNNCWRIELFEAAYYYRWHYIWLELWRLWPPMQRLWASICFAFVNHINILLASNDKYIAYALVGVFYIISKFKINLSWIRKNDNESLTNRLTSNQICWDAKQKWKMVRK